MAFAVAASEIRGPDAERLRQADGSAMSGRFHHGCDQSAFADCDAYRRYSVVDAREVG